MENLKKFLEKFKSLGLSEHEYAIYGSGPMAIRGLREANDLDVVVFDETFEKLKEKYSWGFLGEKLQIEEIEIFPASNSLFDDPERVISRAENIQGFKFATLQDILDWKRKIAREKDLEDIRLIEKYLNESEKG